VKYSGTIKSIGVRVRTTRDHAVVEISDRGVGIQPRDQKRIFERFYRSAGSNRPGFGLGLPIVRELIAAHGGRVEVDSTPGLGSIFRVWLPLESSEEQRYGHRAVARA
jgi:signal transduction histidine kinase